MILLKVSLENTWQVVSIFKWKVIIWIIWNLVWFLCVEINNLYGLYFLQCSGFFSLTYYSHFFFASLHALCYSIVWPWLSPTSFQKPTGLSKYLGGRVLTIFPRILTCRAAKFKLCGDLILGLENFGWTSEEGWGLLLYHTAFCGASVPFFRGSHHMPFFLCCLILPSGVT